MFEVNFGVLNENNRIFYLMQMSLTLSNKMNDLKGVFVSYTKKLEVQSETGPVTL